ncbi:MAG TPA: outer membrane protein assembly factor BamE [Steroidobacteraceae bacterium]|nr:outer membrane protein assembly factor BamE [Steroidobacteraceae bacterium]
MRFPATPARRRAALALAALVPFLPGCVYKMTIQQGNYIEKRSVAQLQVGMTRVQVRYLMGTPMVPPIFDNDRWDYLYYLRIGRDRPIQRMLTVYFKDDKVSRIDKYGKDPSMPDEPLLRSLAPML